MVYSRAERLTIQEADRRLVDMFLDERLKKATTFLLADVKGERTPIGTAFFLIKSFGKEDELVVPHGPLPPLSHYTTYVVTAGHVIVDYHDLDIYIRVNTMDGACIDVPTRADDWHTLLETDVAVYDTFDFGGSLDYKTTDIYSMAFSMLSTDEYMEEALVKEGHEVFILGLFIGHFGKQRVLPVIRFGNIALALHEKVEVFLSNADKENNNVSEINAYLVESRSMGGLSGSPVLFYEPPLGSNIVGAKSTGAQALMTSFQRPIIFGLVHGQYDEPETMIQRLYNAGISIVVPAKDIRKLIMGDRLMADRKQQLEQLRKRKEAVLSGTTSAIE